MFLFKYGAWPLDLLCDHQIIEIRLVEEKERILGFGRLSFLHLGQALKSHHNAVQVVVHWAVLIGVEIVTVRHQRRLSLGLPQFIPV
jgi:uncharacterized protein (UPF0128 family)